MSKIVFIAADDTTAEMVSNLAIKDFDFPLNVMVAFGPARLKLVDRLVSRDKADIIISRWGFEHLDFESKFPVTILDVPITAFDLIRSLHKAQLTGKRIGVVHNQSVVQGMVTIARYLNINLASTVVISKLADKELIKAIQRAEKDGAELIIAGITACSLCPPNHSNIPLQAGPESIRQALDEARRIVPAQLREREKAERFQAILEFAYDGVIAVDREGLITMFNHKAEELLGVPRDQAVGVPISRLQTCSVLPKVLTTGKPALDVLHTVAGKDIVSNNVPFTINEEVAGAVQTFLEVSRLQETEGKVRRKLSRKGLIAKLSFDDIIGHSKQIEHVIHRARRYAQVQSSILIQGETGTGKEIFAQSIHRASRRSTGPFVAVNCAALPETILESELFGYVEGAFTGARREGKVGLFELAHGGTIFLDEVSELPLQIQGRFLRVLQEHEVSRIGDDRIIPIDIRVIAATNRDLSELVANGKFRSDLHYRLNVLLLSIPPLRDRLEDVPELLTFFIEMTSATIGISAPQIPDAVLQSFISYSWPGNVRELANMAERLVAVSNENGEIPKDEIELACSQLKYTAPTGMYSSRLDDLETSTIMRVLLEVNGNKRKAAEKLGISVTTLWRRLNALGI